MDAQDPQYFLRSTKNSISRIRDSRRCNAERILKRQKRGEESEVDEERKTKGKRRKMAERDTGIDGGLGIVLEQMEKSPGAASKRKRQKTTLPSKMVIFE